MRKHLLDALLGLAITALLFIGVEALLGATGAGAPLESSNWSRGFDTSAAYLVPDPEVDGGWRTQFKKNPDRERRIPPRADNRRVLLFGGSNTGGFPTQYMRDHFRRITGDGEAYDVHNLGREGYGSARVRIIFEQALENLDPDVVVIYAGHNEFVEKGFLMDLEAAGLTTGSSWLQERARDTNLFRALVRQYTPSTTAGTGGTLRPEAWEWEYSKFRSLHYGETQRYFELYADNLRAMTRAALDRGVDVVLCTIVHNRLAPPFGVAFPPDLTKEGREAYGEVYARARALLPDYLGPLLPVREEQRVHQREFKSHGAYRPERAARFESDPPSHGFLAGREPLRQLREDWEPHVRELDAALVRWFARDLGGSSREDLERAEELYGEALELIPDHPRALFELAVTRHLLGRDGADVTRLFEEAARFDRAPRKGNAYQNGLVKQVAAEFDEVLLVDVDQAFVDSQPDGLVGWKWMDDHCHLGRGARRAVIELLANAIEERWPVEGTR